CGSCRPTAVLRVHPATHCMSRASGIVSAVFAAAFLAAAFVTTVAARGAAEDEAAIDDGWRRTASGWEHVSQWTTTASHSVALGHSVYAVAGPTGGSPPVHPALFAVFEFLAAIGALRLAAAGRKP